MTQPLTGQLTPSLLPSRTRPSVDLNGPWSFALDPSKSGVDERWFDRDLAEAINVPGSWEEQGFGEPEPEFIGGWTKRRSYEGAAWYSRQVAIPADWTDHAIWLQLDRVGWQSTLFIDGVEIGVQDSLSAPHRFDISAHVEAGQTHRLAIRVDNKLEGVLNYEGHIHSRHTATTWGGIIGNARLVATPKTWIEHVEIYPSASDRSVRVVVRVAGASPESVQTVVSVRQKAALASAKMSDSEVTATGTEATLQLGENARLWSDRDPFLYDITVSLDNGDEVHDRFGLRTFEADGRALTLNGEQVFLRGYVDCCIFPLTGYPPEDKEVYAKQFAKAKEWGFNHVRLHSWTPGRAFFEAADEAGMLVQSELPNWANCNSAEFLGVRGRPREDDSLGVRGRPREDDSLGVRGRPREDDSLEGTNAKEFLTDELHRVVPFLQRHPSLVIHSMGNELLQSPRPNGAYFRYSPFLNDLVRVGRSLDESRLFADQTGHGFMPEEAERETDLFILHTFRGSTPDTTSTWQDKIAGGKTPVIAHEHTQMDMYARFEEIEKFTGIMEPSWLLQAQVGLASKGILEDADRHVEASGALQKHCLKELFERLRRTPGLSGVQMLNFTDFPGQGSALNGVLDVFWDDKGHISADEFRQFNAETVLLCETQRRTFAVGSYLEADLSVSHFGGAKNGHGGGGFEKGAQLEWTLHNEAGDVIAEGAADLSSVQPGSPTRVAHLSVRLPEGQSDTFAKAKMPDSAPAKSQKLTLTAKAPVAKNEWVGNELVKNEWNFWAFDDTRWQGAPEQNSSFGPSSIRLRPTIQWLADYYSQMKVDTYDFMHGSREKKVQQQVLISDRLHVRYVDPVINGATLIWLAEDDELADAVESGFESLFWSFLWFPEQANSTMGLTVEDHPLLDKFPHDGTSDWQWYHLVDGAKAISLDALPAVQPIVGGIDNWNRGKRLSYLWEARVGKGRVLVTTLKLLANYHTQPEAVNLLDAMVRYVHSDAFQPKAELTMAQLWSVPKTPVGWSRP